MTLIYLPVQKKDEELFWQVDREPNMAPSPINKS